GFNRVKDTGSRLNQSSQAHIFQRIRVEEMLVLSATVICGRQIMALPRLRLSKAAFEGQMRHSQLSQLSPFSSFGVI
ncbi:hypothetical protein F2P79_017553, partial [Pimephales promelas]